MESWKMWSIFQNLIIFLKKLKINNHLREQDVALEFDYMAIWDKMVVSFLSPPHTSPHTSPQFIFLQNL